MDDEEIKIVVRKLLNEGFRLSPEMLPVLKHISQVNIDQVINNINGKTDLLTPEIIEQYLNKDHLDPQRSKSKSQAKFSSLDDRINPTVQTITIPKQSQSVIYTPDESLEPLTNYESQLEVYWEPNFSDSYLGNTDDMLAYFSNRFDKLHRLLRKRGDIKNLTKISYIPSMRQNDPVSVIGMVVEKQLPSTGGGIIRLDDPRTERVLSVVISKKRGELIEQALKIMNDSVIGVIGSVLSDESILAEKIVLPDIPLNHKVTKANIPVHAAFLSDIHVGSIGFLEKVFDRFIQFINGEYGNRKMRRLGEVTKYVLFAGDVVDGVGVYPNQEDELVITNISDQYNAFTSFVERIPEDVEIVIIPGNHDQVRPAEPQPVIPAIYADDLHHLPNVHLLPNPSQVKLHGVKTLLYHCTSLPDILNYIPGLQAEKPVEVMIKMLQARHLAPIWDARTPLAAEPEDNLVVEHIPDIFHGGHIHINDIGNYNNVRIINSGTMQEQSGYQKALNITPTPGEVIVMNLQTLTGNLLRLL